MGACSSFCCIIPSTKRLLPTGKPFEVLKQTLQQFGMTEKDICHLYLLFHDMLDDCHVRSEYAKLQNLIDFFEVEDTPFVRRLFSVFDHDQNGRIHFIEFAITLWAYCPLAGPDFPLFTFDLYDYDGTGQLSTKQLKHMFEDIYGKDFLSDKRVQENLVRLSRTCQEKDANGIGIVRAEDFQFYVRKAHSMLFPAFKVQNKLQFKSGGEKYWKKVRKRQANKAKPRLHMIQQRAVQGQMRRRKSSESPTVVKKPEIRIQGYAVDGTRRNAMVSPTGSLSLTSVNSMPVKKVRKRRLNEDSLSKLGKLDGSGDTQTDLSLSLDSKQSLGSTNSRNSGAFPLESPSITTDQKAISSNSLLTSEVTSPTKSMERRRLRSRSRPSSDYNGFRPTSTRAKRNPTKKSHFPPQQHDADVMELEESLSISIGKYPGTPVAAPETATQMERPKTSTSVRGRKPSNFGLASPGLRPKTSAGDRRTRKASASDLASTGIRPKSSAGGGRSRKTSGFGLATDIRPQTSSDTRQDGAIVSPAPETFSHIDKNSAIGSAISRPMSRNSRGTRTRLVR
eukprot:CAMPEP_0117734896 /NCGR_PEP_ID=MMETSP0947-20121206/960_1 /TAXON_ID=44440 /ORGANISM="Chattonella subsalsa, Strain CCMP2191" /LENGTH=563 /DNA_ID=CAMNT_0005549789 /DNA_START=99 /DNA_END=1791 /DNA_ORIENTATION=-